MGKTAKPVEELGNKYGKSDIERLGLFSEMPFMNGKGYVSPFAKPKRDIGRNLLAGGPKTKTDWQDCYFDTEYKRLFIGEAVKGRGRKLKASPFKNVSERPFMPPANAKLHSTPGDWYGTFEGKIDAFSCKMKARAPFKHEGPNPLTGPGKKGGYGYVNICLNPYPDHSVEKYGAKAKYKQYGQMLDGPMVVGTHPKSFFEANPYKNPDNIKPGPTYVPPKEKSLPPLPPGKFVPSGPGKLLGGCKAGCFDRYPEHKAEKYKPSAASKSKEWSLSGTFQPPASGERSYYTCSVINENLRFRVNERNYNSYQPNFIKHLM